MDLGVTGTLGGQTSLELMLAGGSMIVPSGGTVVLFIVAMLSGFAWLVGTIGAIGASLSPRIEGRLMTRPGGRGPMIAMVPSAIEGRGALSTSRTGILMREVRNGACRRTGGTLKGGGEGLVEGTAAGIVTIVRICDEFILRTRTRTERRGTRREAAAPGDQ